MKYLIAKCCLMSLCLFAFACTDRCPDGSNYGTCQQLPPPQSDVIATTDTTPVQVVDCRSDSDCNDGNACSTETCDDGNCRFVFKTCDDGNACTWDMCNPGTGECVNPAKSCDDGNPATQDSCNKVSGDCDHLMVVDKCAGVEVSDDNPCTTDYCDSATGEVKNIGGCVEGQKCVDGECRTFCEKPSDCEDGNLCNSDNCDLNTGTCLYSPKYCNDDNPATIDFCDSVTGECQHATQNCEGTCDDGNDCTVDAFNAKCECVHVGKCNGTGVVCAFGQCLPAPCTKVEDCQDDNLCTFDYCDGGVCKHPNMTNCTADEVCDATTGECLELETPDCTGDIFGPSCDDHNPATVDGCNSLTGECFHHQPVSCAEGLILNPKTGECELAIPDAQCVEGRSKCQQFKQTGTLAYAVCHSGAWFIAISCGPIGGDKVCMDGIGCQVVPQN